MSRITNQDTNRFLNKVDNYGTALKTPSFGGPFKADYGANTQHMGAADHQFAMDHPRFPDYVYPEDKERDTHMNIKKKLAQNSTITGLVHANSDDIQYFKDKKAAQELAMFKQFVEDSIPRGTPWAKDYFEKIMPGWYQSKIEIINEKMSIVQRYIDITVRGPQNIDDMFLLYQIYTGKYALPGTFSDLINGASVPRQDFASGLFNPNRWVETQVRVAQRNQSYMANFAIPGIDHKELGAAAQAAVNPDLNVNLAAENVFAGGMSHLRTAAGIAPADAGFWGANAIGLDNFHLAANAAQSKTYKPF